MPDGFLRSHVVVVETAGVCVEQLPPLGCIGALDVDALRMEKRSGMSGGGFSGESDQLLFYFGNRTASIAPSPRATVLIDIVNIAATDTRHIGLTAACKEVNK